MQPDHEIIGSITLLSSGFVINIRGKTVACRDAKELGKQAEKLCKRLKIPEAPPMGNAPMPTWTGFSEPAPNVAATPETNGASVPAPATSAMGEGQKIQLELSNLRALCQARAQSLISPDDFYQGVARYCPDIHDEAVQQMLAECENAVMRYDQMSQFRQCLCSNGLCQQAISIPNTKDWCRSCLKGEHLHPMPGQEIIEEREVSLRAADEAQMGAEIHGYVQPEDEGDPDEAAEGVGEAVAYDKDGKTSVVPAPD